MKQQKTIMNWNPDEGITTFTIIDTRGNTFSGMAKCHPEDKDMLNEYTGYDIAYRRAVLKMMKFYKNNDLITKYNALNHYYNVIKNSKFYNPQSYEAKMLQRQLIYAMDDIEATDEIIKEFSNDLQYYIEQKDLFYKKVRSLRKVKQLEEEHKKN